MRPPFNGEALGGDTLWTAVDPSLVMNTIRYDYLLNTYFSRLMSRNIIKFERIPCKSQPLASPKQAKLDVAHGSRDHQNE